jgi:undecaprenyl-diphosphatase
MNTIEALVLGIIQGLTEFLPISSSGHLEIGKALFGSNTIGQESLFITIALHVGTRAQHNTCFSQRHSELDKRLVCL